MERDRAYLLDILEAARLAVGYVRGFTKEDFLLNTQVQDSVVRRLEIIGEAAKRVSVPTRETLPLCHRPKAEARTAIDGLTINAPLKGHVATCPYLETYCHF